MLKHPLKKKAEEVGLKNIDLAIKLKVSERTIYRYFNGEFNNVDALKKKCIGLCIEQAIKRRKYEYSKIK